MRSRARRRRRRNDLARVAVCLASVARASGARGDATANAADDGSNTQAGATDALLDVVRVRVRASEAMTASARTAQTLEASLSAAIGEREAFEAFEAFATTRGLKREYCGSENSWPCEESARRAKIFAENFRVLSELEATASLGDESRRHHHHRDDGDGDDGERDESKSSKVSSRVRFGPNLWSVRTKEEFEKSIGTLKPSPTEERDRSKEKKDGWRRMHQEFLRRNEDIWKNERSSEGDLFDAENLPTHWDWRDVGGVGRVWEQGLCGGCWAFTTAAAVEGVHYIWTKEPVTLSPQMLLECDPIDQDCVGGNMVTGYQYAVMKGGISAAGDYPVHPYTLKTSEVGPCRTNTARKHAASIDDYIILDNDWKDLKSAIYMQPVSVAVNALGAPFRFYSGGILTYDDCQPDWNRSPNLINHAVVAVGYGHDDDSDLDYVIIKNSWGENWGEGGYARIAIQGEAYNATCGLLIEAVAPLKLSNLTYADPDYIQGLDDFIDWTPKMDVNTVGGIVYVVLTAVVLVAALSMGVLTVISCMTEDDGYYYSDLDYDEYDKHFNVKDQKFGSERDLSGLSVSRERSRFEAHSEPVTGLEYAGRSGRDPRDQYDVVPVRDTL